MTPLNQLVIVIKGAGEMASAVAWRLYMSNFRKILMLETDCPLAVRRAVSFCEAVHKGEKKIENVKAERAQTQGEIKQCWENNKIAVMVDRHWQTIAAIRPAVSVDAVLAKKNLGTHMNEAPLVIGLGPGFYAGKDVHLVIETHRGHHLGIIITTGEAQPNTGTPGAIAGFSEKRVLRSPEAGQFLSARHIGEWVKKNEIIGSVAGVDVRSSIEGVLRGLIRPNSQVTKGLKIGDIDPRGERNYCFTISDKARAIGGSVLEAILRFYNHTPARINWH
ncbi:MAG: selenium-dependent molybdenum cofactor biosynthesis protein YqeB [Desulfobacterales bacterium]